LNIFSLVDLKLWSKVINKYVFIFLSSGLSVWKDEMIMPLVKEIIDLLLEGILQDRDGSASYQMTSIMQGVINSFVCVEEYKQKMQQQVSIFLNLPFNII